MLKKIIRKVFIMISGAVFSLLLFFAPEIFHDGYTYAVENGVNIDRKVEVIATTIDEVFVETKEGNVYSFSGNGYKVGDKCWVVLHNDKIVETQKIKRGGE